MLNILLYILVVSSFVFSAPVSNDIALQVAQNTFIKYHESKNIDNFEINEKFQEDLNFHCEGLKIYITHIGGYPGNYNKRVKKVIEETRPNVFICGHSHILKVIYDKKNDLLHMNPGACGLQGFHKNEQC